jgi:TPR repeat protein
MYLHGKGCEVDKYEAIEWLELAANQGNAKAAQCLGI